MRKIKLGILCIIFYQPLNAQLVNYGINGKAKIVSQSTSLSITTQSAVINSPAHAAGAVLGTVLPPLLNLAVKTIQEKAKQNAAKFTNSFTVNASGSQFWENADNANLPILTITREVILKNNVTGGAKNAITIVLKPELSNDHSAFRFVVSTPFTYTYSSAKTRGKYQFVDIKLDITFTSLIIDKSQYTAKDLRTTSITIPMVQVGAAYNPGTTIASGWFPLPPIATLTFKNAVATKKTEQVTTSGTKGGTSLTDNVTTTTKTTNENVDDVKELDTKSGQYEFQVVVTETNPLKARADNTQSLISNSSDALSDLFKAIGTAISPKDDKSDKSSSQ